MSNLSRRVWLYGGAAVGALTVKGGVLSEPGAQAIEPDGIKKTSSGGGYDYRRPDLDSGSRLVFQGDSITDMKWGRNEKDRNHYLGHSYVYLIAARLGVDAPKTKLDFYNRGMSGHKVGDLRERWTRDAIELEPDLLSVLVGVNDVGRNLNGVDVARWEEDYCHILRESRTANPQLRMVLLDPFVLPSGRLADQTAYQAWRTQVDRLIPIVDRLAAEFDAVHVQTQVMFDTAAKHVSPEHLIWDGVHPLPQGHELIAREWIKQVSERWPV
jgi:lysophospholipase L1-like esterase